MEQRFNPRHDASGQFASSGGGSFAPTPAMGESPRTTSLVGGTQALHSTAAPVKTGFDLRPMDLGDGVQVGFHTIEKQRHELQVPAGGLYSPGANPGPGVHVFETHKIRETQTGERPLITYHNFHHFAPAGETIPSDLAQRFSNYPAEGETLGRTKAKAMRDTADRIEQESTQHMTQNQNNSVNEMQHRKAIRQAVSGSLPGAGAPEPRFNPHHDPSSGEFVGGGAAQAAHKVAKAAADSAVLAAAHAILSKGLGKSIKALEKGQGTKGQLAAFLAKHLGRKLGIKPGEVGTVNPIKALRILRRIYGNAYKHLTGSDKRMLIALAEQRFNPNHDADGQFTSGGGGGPAAGGHHAKIAEIEAKRADMNQLAHKLSLSQKKADQKKSEELFAESKRLKDVVRELQKSGGQFDTVAAKPAEAPKPPTAATTTPKLFESEFHQAYDKADPSGRGLVTVKKLRDLLPHYSREEFDAGLRKLRMSDHYTMDSSQGSTAKGAVLNDADRQAGIKEGTSHLVYVSRKNRRSFDDRNVEYRAISSGGSIGTLHGYAAIYNSPSEPLGKAPAQWTEIVKPGAFSRSLATNPDVVCRYDHGSGGGCLPLGRTSSGTLRLAEDSHGLKYTCDLPNTSAARDLIESMKRGDVAHSSFAFNVNGSAGERWSKGPGGIVTRELHDVDLHDVSPVASPAYRSATARFTPPNVRDSDNLSTVTDSVPMRSLAQAEAELRRREMADPGSLVSAKAALEQRLECRFAPRDLQSARAELARRERGRTPAPSAPSTMSVADALKQLDRRAYSRN
jgi:HK97 family phage prohead protease